MNLGFGEMLYVHAMKKIKNDPEIQIEGKDFFPGSSMMSFLTRS